MKRLVACAVAAVMMLGTTVVSAEEVKSGLQSGAQIGAFNVEKLAGASFYNKNSGIFCLFPKVPSSHVSSLKLWPGR